MYDWIRNHGYVENNVDQLTHFEKYLMTQNPYADRPELVIMIPVKEK